MFVLRVFFVAIAPIPIRNCFFEMVLEVQIAAKQRKFSTQCRTKKYYSYQGGIWKVNLIKRILLVSLRILWMTLADRRREFLEIDHIITVTVDTQETCGFAAVTTLNSLADLILISLRIPWMTLARRRRKFLEIAHCRHTGNMRIRSSSLVFVMWYHE